MKTLKSGKFLVSDIGGYFPETYFCDTLTVVRKRVKNMESNKYRIFRVNNDGLIQRCNLSGRVF